MSSNNIYSSLSTSHKARETEEKKKKERKQHILCLIEQFCREEGYLDIADFLITEAPSCKNYSVCDNVDLNTILQEYESYFYLRFQKYPKICKKNSLTDKNACVAESQRRKSTNRHSFSSISENVLNKFQPIDNISNAVKPLNQTSLTMLKSNSNIFKKIDNHDVLDLTILGSGSKNPNFSEGDSEKMLRTINPFYDNSREQKDMACEISKDIICENPNIEWNDIIGHEEAKKILKESILYPLRYPEIFNGILRPWKSILLYGPPGTGKSMLAKAVATEGKTTFISISPSTINSKWRGDSEKLVKVLFDLAYENAPSTIFIEEIDALVSRRDLPMEHEASRRMKTELFLQLDKLVHDHNSTTERSIFFMATTNIPWEIDPAMLRRIEKRILVDLPNSTDRRKMFEYFLPPNMKEKWNGRSSLSCILDYSELANITEGYSGSDIKLVCKESLMQIMRDIFLELDKCNEGKALLPLHTQKLTTKEVKVAVSKTKPTVAKLSIKFQKWKDDFGSE